MDLVNPELPQPLGDKHRLNAPYLKSRSGRRYLVHELPAADLEAVRQCVRVYLGL